MTEEKAPAPGLKFASREVFEQILEYAVIPTFDLVIEVAQQGVVLVRRSIAPYKDVWALPGLRMFKPEEISDTITRIAGDEVGLSVDPEKRVCLGQFVGKFEEEHNRQDLSTGYYLSVSADQAIRINKRHFSAVQLVQEWTDVPDDTGEMYRFYLGAFFSRREDGEI